VFVIHTERACPSCGSEAAAGTARHDWPMLSGESVLGTVWSECLSCGWYRGGDMTTVIPASRLLRRPQESWFELPLISWLRGAGDRLAVSLGGRGGRT
jgi:hypothetical protein